MTLIREQQTKRVIESEKERWIMREREKEWG